MYFIVFLLVLLYSFVFEVRHVLGILIFEIDVCIESMGGSIFEFLEC